MLEMMVWTMFAIVSMMRIIGVEILKSQNVQNNLHIWKIWKHGKSFIHCVRHVGNDDLSSFSHS